MANRRKNLGGGRSAKPSKTIDLEASEVVDEAKLSESAEDGEATQSTAAGSQPSDESVGEDIAGDVTSGSEEVAENDQMETAPAKPVRARASLGSLLLSAILGGGVALGGASLLGNNSALKDMPLIGGLVGGDTSQAVTSEIASLKEQIAQLNNASNAIAPEMNERLLGLESNIAALFDETGNAEASRQVAEALALAQTASQKAEATSKQITELNDKIIDGVGDGSVDMETVKLALSTEITQLSNRIAGLETSGAGVPESVTGEISAIKESVASLAGLTGQYEALSQQASEISQTVEASNKRLSELETSVNEKVLPSMGSVEKAAVAAIESQKVARSVSARSLSAVLENGGAFNSELASAEALLGSSETINQLRDLSRKGISSKPELLASFQPVADRIIALQSENTSEMGVLERLMSSATTLVKVRPAGPIDGDDNAAVVSRIEAALKIGNVSEALAESEKLNEVAKSAAAGWNTSAKEYLQADSLINQLIGELSASSSEQG
ncbi:MAG: hypothetical protein WBD01_07065 [Salaquimonas sp.]